MRETKGNKTKTDLTKYRAYLDIETTGFSSYYCDLTLVGIALEKRGRCEVVQLYEDTLTPKNLLDTLRYVEELYSYNGSRFDLPFIGAKFGIDLKQYFRHTDLMYDCWRNNLKGGLKAVERRLGIERRLCNIDGFMAVRLWHKYKNNNNKAALKTLLEYNSEDVLNLRILRNKLSVK
jgi:uncharacterized protein YprB with RNaseH-like and TPR domain